MRDYFIAEGVFDGGDEGEERPPEFEARGTGANKFCYWATNSPLEDWTKLPDVLPKELQAARKNKVEFTGDLERVIITNPFFFGREKHFLRSQIARISHCTTIVPKGLFIVQEDNDREIADFVPEEGPVPIPSTAQMSRPEFWVHH
mmetsp:Transcript_7261/g.5533  ORF Transcript_7261/g.5533 Transcript_7261/m.5533 type:complete len:146 (-) Transcript_7261:513-950(-)